MRRLTAVHPPPHHALGVLYRDAALPLLHHDNRGDNRHEQDGENDQTKDADAAFADILDRLDDPDGKLGDDPGENDQRDAVADPVLVIFSPSHMRKLVPAVRVTTISSRLKNVGSVITLLFLARTVMPYAWIRPEHHRAVPGVLLDLFAPFDPFFRQLLQAEE